MTDPTQNALTPDEWNAWQERGELIRHLNYFAACEPPGSGVLLDGPMAGRDAHAAAALCLYQQPFGFTQEDVDWIRARCHDTDDVRLHGESLASRISALLPTPQP